MSEKTKRLLDLLIECQEAAIAAWREIQERHDDIRKMIDEAGRKSRGE